MMMAGNNSNIVTNSATSRTITVRVLAASTGVTFRINLAPSELTVSNIRGHLAAVAPTSDQILLLGPPYKVPKETALQSDEILHSLRLGDIEDDPITEERIPQQQQHNLSSTQQQSERTEDTIATSTTTEKKYIPAKLLHTTSGACRLFLFSKQALSENSPDPPPCRLEPMNIQLPTEAPGLSPLNIDASSSPPLHQALAAYERQFMLYLAQGRVLADAADLRLAAIRTCVQEQAVMSRALRAAVSNLSDYYHRAARTRTEFTAAFQAETTRHTGLLQRFESVLNSLSSIPLHPSLRSIASTAGRPMSTLLDTVPVEREKAWAQQCHTAHHRLLSLFQELDTAFSELGTATTRQEEVRQDRLAEDEIEKLWQLVETIARDCCERQGQQLDKLTVDHQEVLRIVTNAISSDNDIDVQNALMPLGEMSKAAKPIIPSMIADDTTIKDIMTKVAESKTNSMKRMKMRLRDVSIAQSAIQRCLTNVGVLRDALSQQSENMVHLEHVAELPNSYKAFLSELRRRRAYGVAVITTSTAMMERLAVMRADEVKARESFLRGPGKHLMPAFFDTFVPTLATPPPIFTPQIPAMLEMDTLPDVTDDAIMTGESSLDAVMQSQQQEHGGSTSTLTTEITSNNPQPNIAVQRSERQQDNFSAQQDQSPNPQQQQQQDQLIVSADEILDPAAGAATEAVINAELKTLTYENAILRQELERLGGKPPPHYVEQTKYREAPIKSYESEITALRKELEAVNEQARVSKAAIEALTTEKANSDKISHSSFDIGDIVLFMPAGRNKRTYIAFHTNCPHRYLNTDCVEGTPDYILGRIVYQEELVAGESGTDANPYNLPVGTTFWVMTVEDITPKKK